jgi:hypothetical protein
MGGMVSEQRAAGDIVISKSPTPFPIPKMPTGNALVHRVRNSARDRAGYGHDARCNSPIDSFAGIVQGELIGRL